MKSRLDIYHAILRIGLLNIRAAAAEDDVRQCFAEADHVHNLPDLLMHPEDEDRHQHYWETMRPGYISISKLQWVERFRLLWDELEAANADDGR